jgi:HSP20 family protein
MRGRIPYNKEPITIYPGRYQPLPWKEKELLDEIKAGGAKIIRPPVNISEMTDYYKIEMPVPGFNSQDFFVHTQGRSLSISAINKKTPGRDETHYLSHNFNWHCILRHITLPPDTDASFATAEYRNGVLSLYIYKTLYPGRVSKGQIIVY